jgi:hypothetical protein
VLTTWTFLFAIGGFPAAATQLVTEALLSAMLPVPSKTPFLYKEQLLAISLSCVIGGAEAPPNWSD